MQEQKLTLENFDDLALELLRKENYDSSEIKFEWGYSDKFTKEDIEKIRDIKEKMGFDYLEDAVNEYLFDINSEVHFEMQNQIIDKVLNKYVDSDSPDYDEISEKLSETLGDYFTLNMNGEAVLENTDVGEINIFLCSDNEKKLYEESFALESFENPKKLKEFLEEDKFNPMVFLIQSQGYEVEDLYDKEKVENSKFLKSLKTEIEEHSGSDYGNIVFTKIRGNFEEMRELEESDKNIRIPKEMREVGIVDTNGGAGSLLEIELEKDIVIDRKNAKVVSDFNQEGYSIQEIYGLIDTPYGIDFKLSDEKGFETHDFNVEKVYDKAMASLDKEDLEEFLEKMPTFDEFVENKLVSDIKDQYLFNNQQDLFFEKSTPEKLAESLVNEREKENGAMISPELDKAIFEKYEKEEDFGNATTLREVMLEKYEEKIKNNILNIESKVRNTSLLLEEYKVDENNLTVGDVKTLGDVLSNERIFTNKEILEDIRFEKELAPTFDKEKIDEKTVENLKEVFKDWKKLKEESFESFNEFLSVSSDKIKDEVFKEEFSYYKDNEIDKDLFRELNIAYNKEYKLGDDLKKIEEKNKLLDTDKLEKINTEVKEMLGDVIAFMEDSGHIEKQGNNYVFKDDILDKNNFRDMMSEFIPNEFEFKEDMLLKNLSRSELIERYDIATPNFEIYTKNGDEIFYSYVNDYSDIDDIKGKLEKFIIETKGQEFWNNMDYYNINDWDNLLKNGEVIGISINEVEENQFTSVDEYLSPIFDNGEIFDYICDEIKTYGEELRQELASKVENNVIDGYEYKKIREKYEVEEKESKQDKKEKEVEKYEKNEREIEF